jgi:DNA-binding response OmpR family regulator
MIKDNPSQYVDSTNTRIERDPQSPYRILLVDDDVELLELHAEILIRCGYNVDTAANGFIAWNTVHETNYDLLITDNNMPRLTGLELVKQVRSEGLTLPIILASGSVPTEELNQNSWLRIDATLPKPFKTDALLATVKKVLCAKNVTENDQCLH